MPMHASTAPLLGILMLNTRFPRPPGDIGNPETWPFPVRYEVVEPATVGRVVTADPPVDLLLAPFVAAGERDFCSWLELTVRAASVACLE